MLFTYTQGLSVMWLTITCYEYSSADLAHQSIYEYSSADLVQSMNIHQLTSISESLLVRELTELRLHEKWCLQLTPSWELWWSPSTQLIQSITTRFHLKYIYSSLVHYISTCIICYIKLNKFVDDHTGYTFYKIYANIIIESILKKHFNSK